MSEFDTQDPRDPLAALWKSAPGCDTRQLIQDLERWSALHRRLNLTVFAILWGVATLLLLGAHWGLSSVWIIALLVGTFLRRRSRQTVPDVLSFDTACLLRRMVARAKRDLFLARCLYAGVPCGALAGYWLAPAEVGTRPQWQAISGLAALAIMMAAGLILARSRRTQVQDLNEKLARLLKDL